MVKLFVDLLLVLSIALCDVPAAHAADRLPRRPANLHQAVSEPQADGHMVSWVVLSNSYVKLSEETLRSRLDEAFPGEFVPARNQRSFVVEGPVAGAQFLIQSRVEGASGTFMLNSVPGPYTRFSNFAAAIKDRAIRQRAQAQRSWLSINLIAKHAEGLSDAYRFIGRALAKLAPRDAAHLVHPTRNVIIEINDAVRRKLELGEPIP